MHRTIRDLILCSMFLFAVSGCSDDESSLSGPTPVDETPLPAATTPEQLLSNLETAIETLDPVEFTRLLHEDYRFWFSPEDIDLTGVTNWSRAQELTAITHLFSGEEGSREVEGSIELIPGVVSIQLNSTPLQAWTDDFDDGMEFSNAHLRGIMHLDLVVRYTDADLVSSLSGSQVLYVVGVLVRVEGQIETHWRIIGWKDLGALLRSTTEGGTWGGLKARFVGIEE